MCCNRINTDVLLANLFALTDDYPVEYAFDYLKVYLRFLSERFPTYLTTNLSEQMVRECVARYPDLYQIFERGDELVVAAGELIPNLDYFNAVYPSSVSDYIKELTQSFVQMHINA